VAILLRIVAKDWSDAGWKPAFRRHWAMYAAIIAGVPLAMLITILLGTIVGITTVTGFKWYGYLEKVLPGIGVFLVFAAFEEIGWRGYLAPKLVKLGLNDFITYLVTGLVWATWHLPFIFQLAWVYNTSDPLLFIPGFYLSMIAYAMVYHEVRLLTGSVMPAILLHALTNAVQHPMAAGFMHMKPGSEILGSFTGLFVIALTAGLGMGLRYYRMRNVARSAPGTDQTKQFHPR
jgi:membrane protease YdiL (CAAX protease family)